MYSKDVLHLSGNKENNMKYLSSVSCLFLVLTSVTVSAADVQVRVFARGGTPLAGVAVCLGTPARISQFGAMQTDENGNAAFSDVPRATLQVTASKNGYKAEQKIMGASTSNRMLVISLPTGGGGIQCPLDKGAASASGRGMVISRLAMNNGAVKTTKLSVALDNVVSGQPTHYRASERADFKGAEWQDYTKAPVFHLSPGRGKKIVYFQVRRVATLDGAKLEIFSPVRQDSILLK